MLPGKSYLSAFFFPAFDDLLFCCCCCCCAATKKASLAATRVRRLLVDGTNFVAVAAARDEKAVDDDMSFLFLSVSVCACVLADY